MRQKQEIHVAHEEREDAGQWLGDGAAFYRMDGMPTLTVSNIPYLFDISADKAADMTIEEQDFPEDIDISGITMAERDVTKADQLITDAAGRILSPMSTDNGLCYLLRSKYIDVLDEEVTFSLRRKLGSEIPYIVAKDGMFVIAMFMPYWDAENTLAGWMSTIAQKFKNTKLTDAVAMSLTPPDLDP